MYGMVNRALQSLIVEHHGAELWERVRRRAGVSDEPFRSVQPYPDGITYGLVKAAVEELDIPADELLRRFGRHWVGYAIDNGYREILSSSAGGFPGFLRGLDAMHARLGLSFPELDPPSFRCTAAGDGELLLHYYSNRPGLTEFVRGLLLGLGDHFGLEVRVELRLARSAGEDHDVFLVGWAG